MSDFTQYVHKFKTNKGETRWAVGQWNQERAQYARPFDAGEQKLTGCGAEFARVPSGIQSFPTRKQALRRARYLFYEMDREFYDTLSGE